MIYERFRNLHISTKIKKQCNAKCMFHIFYQWEKKPVEFDIFYYVRNKCTCTFKKVTMWPDSLNRNIITKTIQ